MNREKTGAALVAVSAAGFGFMAIFAKLAYTGQVNLMTTLSGRFVLAACIMWLVVLVTRQKARVDRSDLKSFFFLSLLGYGGGSTLFFASLQLIPASLASMLLYTHPVMVAVAETFFYKLPMTRSKIFALALSSAGLVLILGTTGATANLPGVALALGAALVYTVYLLYGKRVVTGKPPLVTTSYVITFAAAGFTVYGFFSGGIDFNFPPASWLWVAALAVVSTSLAIMALFAGLERIEAGRAAIISTFEPALTVALSALIFLDPVGLPQVVGGVMVLAGIVILQGFPQKKEKEGGLAL